MASDAFLARAKQSIVYVVKRGPRSINLRCEPFQNGLKRSMRRMKTKNRPGEYI